MKLEDRRLIEDYLPLDAINAIASKEKLHPRRYVELVHYWPARRPITACRAAVYAALAPAPRDDEERDRAASFVVRRVHSERRWENQPAEGWTVDDIDVVELRNTASVMTLDPNATPNRLNASIGLRGNIHRFAAAHETCQFALIAFTP